MLLQLVNQTHLEELQAAKLNKEGQLKVFSADTASKDAAQDVYEFTIKTFNNVDILFLNSGGPKAGTFLDITDIELENAAQQLFLGQARFFVYLRNI